MSHWYTGSGRIHRTARQSRAPVTILRAIWIKTWPLHHWQTELDIPNTICQGSLRKRPGSPLMNMPETQKWNGRNCCSPPRRTAFRTFRTLWASGTEIISPQPSGKPPVCPLRLTGESTKNCRSISKLVIGSLNSTEFFKEPNFYSLNLILEYYYADSCGIIL